MAVVGDVFGLNAVYDRQVENVDNNNFASWPEDSIYGYYGGGFAPGLTPANTALIDRIDFSTETTTVPGNNLPAGRFGLAATSSSSYGYFGGGAPPFLATIDRIDFSSETTSAPGNNLPQGKSGLAAVSNDSYGYFGGGYTPTVVSTVDRIDFSSETISTPGNNLSQARFYLGGTSSDSYGYYGGGGVPTESNRIDRIDFSSETTSVPSNNLTQKRLGAAGTSSGSYGYFGGGGVPTTPARVATVDRIDFFNETTSAPGNNLPQARQQSASISNSIYGYFGGGFTAPGVGSRVTTVDRIDFSSETFSVPSNSLSEGRNALAAVSGGASIARGNGYKTYGYYGGGYSPPGAVHESRIERIDFSTQTDSIIPSRLIYRHVGCNTVSSNNHGYFVGGSVPSPGGFPYQTSKVQRFDFISEIVSELPSQAPFEASTSGTLSNSQYGFVAGGLKGSPIGAASNTLVIRLDFSSDSMSQPSSNLTEGRNSLNGVSDLRNNLGYFGGGYVSCRICRIDLSSDTITQNSVNLQRDSNAARSYQSGDYGYWAGGKYTPNYSPPSARAFSSTQKIAFSTGTTQYAPPMNTGRYAGGVTQDNYYAWYTAGTAPGFVRTSNVQRVELSTETYSNPGNPLAIIRDSNPGGLSN